MAASDAAGPSRRWTRSRKTSVRPTIDDPARRHQPRRDRDQARAVRRAERADIPDHPVGGRDRQRVEDEEDRALADAAALEISACAAQSNRLDTERLASPCARSPRRGAAAIEMTRMLRATFTASVGWIELVMTSSFSFEVAMRRDRAAREHAVGDVGVDVLRALARGARRRRCTGCRRNRRCRRRGCRSARRRRR